MTHPTPAAVTRVTLFALAAAAAGCGGGKAPPPAKGPEKVTVAKPVRQDVLGYHYYSGYIEPVELVNVRARVRGFLKKVAFQEGTEVKQGDPLYEIDPREYEAALARAKADLSRAEAERKRTEAEAQRATKLRGSAAVSEEEYLQRVAGRETAAAAVDQAKAAVRSAELDLSYTTITAPIAGRVSRTQVTEGNLVGYNEPTLLTTIVRSDPKYVLFDVPERRVVEYDRRSQTENLPRAADRKIPVEVQVATETGYPHKGVIDFRENRVDAGTGTARLRGVLPNPDRMLTAGLFAQVRVPQGGPEPRLMVPEAALMADQRGRYVFVVRADNTVEYRPVTVGPTVGPLAAIETGLNPDDRVIVNGLQRAKPGAAVEPQSEDQSKSNDQSKK